MPRRIGIVLTGIRLAVVVTHQRSLIEEHEGALLRQSVDPHVDEFTQGFFGSALRSEKMPERKHQDLSFMLGEFTNLACLKALDQRLCLCFEVGRSMSCLLVADAHENWDLRNFKAHAPAFPPHGQVVSRSLCLSLDPA